MRTLALLIDIRDDLGRFPSVAARRFFVLLRALP
jgi:hypothetical protein